MQQLRQVPKMVVTKEFRFEAAHHLCNNQITEEQNVELFHACYHVHGHSYKLFVTVEGIIDPISGFVVDFKKLKEIVNEKIVKVFDHQNINEIEVFKQNPHLTPTCENMLVYMWSVLLQPIKELKGKLKEITLYETETSHATYRGEIAIVDENGDNYSALPQTA